MYCQHCGEKIKEESNFCPNCGVKKPDTVKPTEIKPNNSMGSITNFTFATIISFVVRLFSILFLPFCALNDEAVNVMDYLEEFQDADGVYVVKFLLIALAIFAIVEILMCFTKKKGDFLIASPCIDMGILILTFIFIKLHIQNEYSYYSNEASWIPSIAFFICLTSSIIQLVYAVKETKKSRAEVASPVAN